MRALAESSVVVADVDVVTGLERGDERGDCHRLGTRGAMRIGPGEAHELEVVPLAPALDLLGLPPLLVAPEAVLFDESEGLGQHAPFHARVAGRRGM